MLHMSVLSRTLNHIQDGAAEYVARTGLCNVRQIVLVRAIHWPQMSEALSRQPMRDMAST